MSGNHAGWPADPAAMGAGRTLVRRAATRRVVIVPDGDADGLCACLVAWRTIERLGGAPRVVLPGKGEHVHTEAMRRRLRALNPELIVVLDMGSRAGEIVRGVATLVVDHHQPRGFPDGATVVSAFGHVPVAATSLLAYELFRPLATLDDLDWAAVLGTTADLGPEADMGGVPETVRRYGRKEVTEAIALLNAPRRSAAHDVAAAWDVLLAATGPSDIARGRVPGVERLREARASVAAETKRCMRTAPRLSGDYALLPFASGAKVHPLVAHGWTTRLSRQIVIAANYGYLPGRVNFAMRTARSENLITRLRALPLPADTDSGYGHPKATGGSLPYADFDRLLAAMGFDPDVVAPDARASPELHA